MEVIESRSASGMEHSWQRVEGGPGMEVIGRMAKVLSGWLMIGVEYSGSGENSEVHI